MKHHDFLITGGSGFIGSQLIPRLLADGHCVTVLSRHPTRTAAKFAGKVRVIADFEQLDDDAHFDAVINLAGQGIADRRWSDSVKQALLDSRINTTRQLVAFLQRTALKPGVLISGSAIGYYGTRASDEPVDEQGAGDNSFSSQLCQQWEREAQAAESLGIRTCYLRTGIVLGKNGGALRKMLPPFKLGLGGPTGNGQQWMAWIHLDDLIGIILRAVEDERITGVINGTAPHPVSNAEFAVTLGKVLKRPTLLPMPAVMVKLLFGEMGEELLLAGQRVVPGKMQAEQYAFQYPQLADALRAVV